MLATPTTPYDKRYVEYFLPGTEPVPLRNNPWKARSGGRCLCRRRSTHRRREDRDVSGLSLRSQVSGST